MQNRQKDKQIITCYKKETNRQNLAKPKWNIEQGQNALLYTTQKRDCFAGKKTSSSWLKPVR